MADEEDEPIIEEPPLIARLGRKPSPILLNLMRLAETPGVWGRVKSYDKSNVAKQVCYDLRSGKRKRPEGKWEFRHGPLEENPSRFGIWARLIPSEENEGGVTNESQTDAGRVDKP